MKCTLVSFSKDPAVHCGLHDGDKTGALVVSAAVAEAPLYRLPRHLIADAPFRTMWVFSRKTLESTLRAKGAIVWTSFREKQKHIKETAL